MSTLTAVVTQDITTWNEPDCSVRLIRLHNFWTEETTLPAIETTVIEAH